MALAHRYRHRVAVQEKTEDTDSDTGDVSHAWSNVWLDSDTELSAVPAEVLTGPGREFNAADAKQAETSARITLRWFPGLLPTMRIVWDGRTYDILSIETDATARREYRLRCREGVSDGA
jgi:SPP1 family predicted phage head-tail adaptor